MSLDVSTVESELIDLDYLRGIVRSPGSRREFLDKLEQQFIKTLPTEKLQHAFTNPPDGTQGRAVLDAMREANGHVLTIIAAAFMGERRKSAESERERTSVVKELGDTLEDAGDDFDPDFREPVN